MYDNQSEETRRRSDTGRDDHLNDRQRLLVSVSHSCHQSHLLGHVFRGRAGDCSDH